MDIKKFAQVAHTIFAPIYPVVAEQMLDKLKINQGVCLEIGTGPGLLAYQIAKKSNLIIIGTDANIEALMIAKELLRQKEDWTTISHKIKWVCSNAAHLPFKDKIFDMSISRGSLFFWENKAKGIREIHRVLKLDGKAMVGGGFGKLALKRRVAKEIKEIYDDWEENVEERRRKFNPKALKELMHKANIKRFKIIYDEVNQWVLFRKDEI